MLPTYNIWVAPREQIWDAQIRLRSPSCANAVGRPMGNYLPTANRTIRVKDDPLSSVLHAYRDRTSHTQAARCAAPGSDAPGSCATTSSVTIAQVRDAYATYADLFPGHNKLDADQFDQVFGSVFGDTDPHFSAWAAGPGGVPILQVFVGIAIHCQGDLAQRSDLVFDVYDLDGSGSMAADEVVMLLQDALRAMCRMAGTRPALDSECLLGAQVRACPGARSRHLKRSMFADGRTRHHPAGGRAATGDHPPGRLHVVGHIRCWSVWRPGAVQRPPSTAG